LHLLYDHRFKHLQECHREDAKKEPILQSCERVIEANAVSFPVMKPSTLYTLHRDHADNDCTLSVDKRGTFDRNWLLDVPRLHLKAETWLTENLVRKGKKNATVKEFTSYCNSHSPDGLLAGTTKDFRKANGFATSISTATAAHWLCRLGHNFNATMKQASEHDGLPRPTSPPHATAALLPRATA